MVMTNVARLEKGETVPWYGGTVKVFKTGILRVFRSQTLPGKNFDSQLRYNGLKTIREACLAAMTKLETAAKEAGIEKRYNPTTGLEC